MWRVLVLLIACSSPGSTPGDAAIDADADAGPDATITTGSWSTPTLVAVPPPTDTDDDVTLTADLGELYINSARSGNYDVFVMKRASTSDAWGPLVLVPFVSTLEIETTPKIHPDGLSMTLARDPGTGLYDLYQATRASRTAPWQPAIAMTELESTASDNAASLTADRRTVVFASTRLDAANNELFIADRASPDVPFDAPVPITTVNSAAHEGSPWISADGLTLYFESSRDGVSSDFFLARRASRSEPFGAVEPIVELSGPGSDQDIWVSPDGRHVTFTSNRGGVSQIWEASR